jgi:hypothetical protein
LSAKDNTASRDRYEIARETIGIPENSLWVFERNVYDGFVDRLGAVILRPEWYSYDRQDFHWISRFSDAYKECLQAAVVELAEMLTQWVIAKRRRAESDHLIKVCFLFADELRRPDFSKLWLAYVVGCTKGPELPQKIPPIELLNEIGLTIPDLDALPDPLISGYFLGYMVSPVWKQKAELTATLRILKHEHLAPSGRSAAVKTPSPPLKWEEIEFRRPSLSIGEAAEVLIVGKRTINNYFKQGKLDSTPKGRVVVNGKLRSEFERVHSKGPRPNSIH